MIPSATQTQLRDKLLEIAPALKPLQHEAGYWMKNCMKANGHDVLSHFSAMSIEEINKDWVRVPIDFAQNVPELSDTVPMMLHRDGKDLQKVTVMCLCNAFVPYMSVMRGYDDDTPSHVFDKPEYRNRFINELRRA